MCARCHRCSDCCQCEVPLSMEEAHAVETPEPVFAEPTASEAAPEPASDSSDTDTAATGNLDEDEPPTDPTPLL